MKNKWLIYLLCGLLLLSANCGEEPIPNPCSDKEPKSADFLIEELIGSQKMETDTVFRINSVRFSAMHALDEYTWTIGGEILHDSTFVRRSFPEKQVIEITLVGSWAPETDCFPTDRGVDTVTKRFYVSDLEGLPYYGNYLGANTDVPGDLFTVRVEFEPNGSFGSMRINNIPKGCDDNGVGNRGYALYAGGKGFVITSGAGNEGVGSCYALNAFATTKDKEIEIAYQYDEASQMGEPLAVDRIVKKTFKGQKP